LSKGVVVECDELATNPVPSGDTPMNTKAAVILMIGLLGSPVAYNFSQPQPVAHDWVFYGGHKWLDSPRTTAGFSFGIVLNRRTGERVKVFEVLVPKRPAHTPTEGDMEPALTAPPLDPPEAPPLELPE
jgi:hypothetical protein